MFLRNMYGAHSLYSYLRGKLSLYNYLLATLLHFIGQAKIIQTFKRQRKACG